MKIELTQKELEEIVRKYYNFPHAMSIDVSVENQVVPAVLSSNTAVNTQSRQNDVSDLLKDVPLKKKSKKHKTSKSRKYTPAGKGEIEIPKNPKLDYTVYGQVIEDFLNSGNDFMVVPLDEGIKNSGMLYRYRIAAKLFGFYNKISLNASRPTGQLIMSRPGKAPKSYPHKKVNPHPELSEYVPC